MKKYSTIYLLLATFLIVSCSDDDDAAPVPIDEPDPRLELLGFYEVNTVELTYTQGVVSATLDLNTNSIIELSLSENINGNQIEVELEDFLEETIDTYYETFGEEVFVNVSIIDEQIASLKDSTLTVRNLDFDMSILYSGQSQDQYWICETNLEASISGNTIEINYFIEGHINDINGTFEGTATGVLLE